jgi:hypothetical protein
MWNGWRSTAGPGCNSPKQCGCLARLRHSACAALTVRPGGRLQRAPLLCIMGVLVSSLRIADRFAALVSRQFGD